jgi:NAD-dependent deacetylase
MLPALEQLASKMQRARRMTAMTGAGVSAASGVPTFRGADGLWRSFRAEDLATPDAFTRDPRLVWEWYDWRRSLIARCDPNPAHDVLARWSTRDAFTLITQNVDGLHELSAQRAGAGAPVLRFHGSIWELRCWSQCGAPHWEDRRAPLPSLPPSCPSCGGVARPGVVWFGEAIHPHVLHAALTAAATCDLFLSIGTSSLVYPAAGLVTEARRNGAFTVEINPTGTGAGVDLRIAMPAEEALPLLEHAVNR